MGLFPFRDLSFARMIVVIQTFTLQSDPFPFEWRTMERRTLNPEVCRCVSLDSTNSKLEHEAIWGTPTLNNLGRSG